MSVHLVGASYGAYTALVLALRRPDLVRSLVLAEPPLIHWLPDLSGGQAVYNNFFEGSAVVRPNVRTRTARTRFHRQITMGEWCAPAFT
jgi:pimeloyl-ACP methyl ester carboxylesterase